MIDITVGQFFVLMLLIGLPLFITGMWGVNTFKMYECANDERVKYIFSAIALSIGLVIVVGDIIWFKIEKNNEDLEEESPVQ